MTVRYPVAVSGDWLCYHRLTGISHYAGSRPDRGHVELLLDKGGVLKAYDARGEYAEMHGLDPIDLAAGDGAAIFLTPFRPFVPEGAVFGKPWISNTPGVAFTLSTLMRHAAVSVRPFDFQRYYLGITGVAEAARIVERDVEDHEAKAHYMSRLEPALKLIAKAETYRTKEALDAVARNRADAFAQCSLLELRKEAARAAPRVAEFLLDPLEYEEPHEDDEPRDLDALIASIANEAYGACQAWRDPQISKHAEVLYWGGLLPLREAFLVFDEKGFKVVNEHTEEGLEAYAPPLYIPAGRQR